MSGGEILERIFNELEESNAIAKLDLRLNQIIDNIEIPKKSNITHRSFNEILTNFVERLCCQKLDNKEIFREAFSIVNKFHDQNGSGYSIAFFVFKKVL